MYYAVGMVGALFVALMLRLFVVDFFVVPSDSMLPAIEPGDFILVDKLSFGARMCCNFDFLEKKTEPVTWRIRGFSVFITMMWWCLIFLILKDGEKFG